MDSKQPFHGIRVVEFGQFVSVPFCAQLLAEGGAEVVKVEALGGDPTRVLRQIAPLETRTFISRNRGKRSLPLALRAVAARPVLDALLGWADVVLMNFRPGLDRELGLDPETLKGRYPRLICGAVTAFGKRGPEAGLAGMDTVVQARTGLMEDIPNYDVHDASVANLRFQSGAVANITSACMLSAGGHVGLDLYLKNQVLRLASGALTIDRPNGREVIEQGNNPTQAEDRAFLQAVQTGDATGIRCSYAEAVKTLAVTLAATQSAIDGRVVSL